MEPTEQYKISQLAATIYAGRISGGVDSTDQAGRETIATSVDEAFTLFHLVGDCLTKKAESF